MHGFLPKLLFLIIIVLLGFRPVTAEEFWWHLARGTTVLSGSLFPSYELLALETNSDADWLGGIPWTLLFELTGYWGVAWLVPVLTGIFAWLCHRSSKRSFGVILLCIVLGVLLGGDVLQPTPIFFDLIGIFLLLKIRPEEKNPTTPWLFQSIAVLIFWANLGVFVGIGYLIFIIRLLTWQTAFQTQAKWAVLAFGAICCTPRGIWTLSDSIHRIAPWLFYDSAILDAFGWSPLWRVSPTFELLLFLLLPIGLITIEIWLKSSPKVFANISFAGFFAVMNTSLIPICSFWIIFSSLIDLERPRKHTRFREGLFLSFSCVLIAVGFWHGKVPLTIGFPATHDMRLLADGLPKPDADGKVWTSDINSAGQFCYLHPNKKACLDTPTRALLAGSGRLQSFVDLENDLLQNRESRYRRGDGKWRGWWRHVKAQQIELLLIPNSAISLHESLVSTDWKPTDLDAATIPYVQASEPEYQPQIIECLKQQDFISLSPWQFDRQQFNSNQLLASLSPSFKEEFASRAALRQAEFFRAIDLPLAALKLSLPLRQHHQSPELMDLLGQCHRQFSEQQLRLSNHVHPYHEALRELAGGNIPTESPFGPRFVKDYRRGQLQKARMEIADPDPVFLYAQAMLELEASRPDPAIQKFQRALDLGQSYWHRQLIRNWLDKLVIDD